MIEIRNIISNSLKEAIKNLWDTQIEPEISLTEGFTFGDLTSNVAFQLASIAKNSPRNIAQQIMQNMDLPENMITAEIAGPGFINFRFTHEYLHSLVKEIIKKGYDFGALQTDDRERIQLEYVSANPTGPLNVVSARAAAVGSAMISLMRHCGYTIEGEYYINDAGNQIRKLQESFIARIRQGIGLEWEIPLDGYRGEYLMDMAIQYADCCPEEYKRITGVMLEGDEPDLDHAKQWIVKEMTARIEHDLAAFNVEMDNFFSEKEFRKTGEVEQILRQLESQGDLFHKEGAVWFDATQYDDSEDPYVLIKSDGDYAYAAVDIAYHRNKLERGFDRIYDIWGPDHHSHINRMKAALIALGYEGRFEVIVLQQVNLLDKGEKVVMSKRAGKIITLNDLVGEVGVDVARYFFLCRRSEAHLDFDLDLARKQSDENPVYYIQYAHARISGILEFAENQGFKSDHIDEQAIAMLKEDEEIELIRKMATWPWVVAKSAVDMAPHHVCFYLHDLARLFHPFYNSFRVVGEDKNLTYARVALCNAIKTNLALGLNLLGISAPENM